MPSLSQSLSMLLGLSPIEDALSLNDEPQGETVFTLSRTSSAMEAAAGAAMAIPIIFMILWVTSLIMNTISAVKLNTLIGKNALGNVSAAKRRKLVDLMAASFALFWSPVINIGLASAFTYEVRTLKL